MNTKTCPICEEGELKPASEHIDVEYRGIAGSIYSYYAVCNECGSEVTEAIEASNNKREMIAFKKLVDNLLTGNDVHNILDGYSITQTQASAMSGRR